MKILKGNYGECRFCNNMDEVQGLPSLVDKSWDLCLTDPPYFTNFKIKGKINYDDTKDFNHLWLNEIIPKTKRIMFSCGIKNLYKYPPADWICCWGKPGSTRTGKGGFNAWEPFLFFGKGKIPLDTVILADCINHTKEDLNHPCPKPINLWYKWLLYFKPTSVLDPFLGSGTTAQVAETLGIPWLGYEIMEEYSVDIEKRIKQGILNRKNRPRRLGSF